MCPHKFGQIAWMTEARLCVFITVTDYSWSGISLTPTGHCMKHLRKHIIKIQSQKPICITSTVSLALHNKPQSPCHRNWLHCKYFYKMSCSSLGLWVLKDDAWVKGLVKSHMIWKLRLHSKYSIWSTFRVVCVRFAAWKSKNQVSSNGKHNLRYFHPICRGFI